MNTVLKKALALITGGELLVPDFKMPKKLRPLKKLTERELIQLESEIGKHIFGPIQEGHRREFFNLDKDTWIWYEEYKDVNGLVKSTTTRYEVKQNGILKAQDGAAYSYLEGQELQDFGVAVQMYYERVMRGVYKRDPSTGQKFSN
jgi:hypothetical protein